MIQDTNVLYTFGLIVALLCAASIAYTVFQLYKPKKEEKPTNVRGTTWTVNEKGELEKADFERESKHNLFE